MKLLFRNTLFASLAGGGHMRIAEAVDYPGITVTSIQETRRAEWRRVICFEGEEVATLELAVAKHTAANPLA